VKRLPPAALLSAVLLAAAGCRTNYVIETTGGAQVITATRPRFEEGFYVWKDARGEEQRISKMRVREIYPATRKDLEPKLGAPPAR
jgi:hypothetical protein